MFMAYVYGVCVCVCVYGCVSLAPILILCLAVLLIDPRALDLQGRCATNELYFKLFFFNQENSTSILKNIFVH